MMVTAATRRNRCDSRNGVQSGRGKSAAAVLRTWRFEHAVKPTRSHTRCKTQCIGYGHEQCSKRRIISSGHCRRFGEVEPAGYVLAWYRLGEHAPSQTEHLAMMPSASDVERAVAELRRRDFEV